MEDKSKTIQEEKITIKGMHCKSCVNSIESELEKLNGVEKVKVDFIEEEGVVRFDLQKINIETIKKKIIEMGYKVDGKKDDRGDSKNRVKIKIGKPNFLINMKNAKIWIPTIVLLSISIVFLIGTFTNRQDTANDGSILKGGSINLNDDSLKIPLSDITTQAKWYEYDVGDKAVKFFIVKAKDGSIKTAFDACDVCYSAGTGYRQEGDYMVCNNCGNRYPISGIGTENKNPGGCWPGYLPNTIEGDYVVIKAKDLADNSWRTL